MRETIPVLVAPMIDPGWLRLEATVSAGASIAEIVALMLPCASDDTLGRVRVALVTREGAWAIPPARWNRVRPRQGVHVVIRIVPGGDSLRSVLSILVTVAATFLAPYLAPFFSVFGNAAQGVAALAITTVGGLLINALIPPPKPATEEKPRFSVSGFRNRFDPGAPVPAVIGQHRYAPPYAAPPYAEIVGDLQYQRAIFCVGTGPVEISDIRLGETSIDDFDQIEVEIREGLPGDAPISLYTEQVLEEQFGVDLRYEAERDEYGELPDGAPPVETPVVRRTAGDCSSAAVVLAFPGGLIAFDDKGRSLQVSVSFRFRYKPVGAAGWAHEEQVAITHRTSESFFRAHVIVFPARGRYEVEVTRVTVNQNLSTWSDRAMLTSLQSRRPEHPLAPAEPTAFIAVRVKASYQLNGALDNLNCVARRVTRDYDFGNGLWVERGTRNAASAFVFILTRLSAKPVADAEIDWEAMAEWHDFCRLKNLKYDVVLEEAVSQHEQMQAAAAAGRASPRFDGMKWSVVIDRPQDLVIDHISPRNADGLRWQRTYIEPPHAFRVPFRDETNDYIEAERIVPWPGHVGDITLIEELPLPGKTDPDEIWIEARRRQYEAGHRTERYTASQDGAIRVATRGDLTMVSFDTLDATLAAGRVRAVNDRTVVLDTEVPAEAGQSYAIRFYVFDEEAGLASSVVASVKTSGEPTQILVVPGLGPLPKAGTIVHFGIAGQESIAAIVAATEAGEDMSTIVTLVPAAPQIDALTDAEVPPAWDGRFGEVVVTTLPPSPPRIIFIDVDFTDPDTGETAITIGLAAGSGSPTAVASYELSHRLSGAGSWTVAAAVPASAATVVLAIYSAGAGIEIKATALGVNGQVSDPMATVSYAIGVAEPAPGVPVGGSVTGGLGVVTGEVVTPASGNLHALVIYRGATSDFGSATEVRRYVGVAPAATVTIVDGDATRPNLLTNNDVTAAPPWSLGTGWTIGSGGASHSAGEGDLSQAAALSEGVTVRGRIIVADRTAGSLAVRLSGGTAVTMETVVGNGEALFSGVVLAGNNTFLLAAGSTFDGTVTRADLFAPSVASVPAGQWHYFATCENDEGRASAPYALTAVTVV